MRHALGKLGERLETTVLEINEQGKEIDRLRVAVAGISFKLALITCQHNLRPVIVKYVQILPIMTKMSIQNIQGISFNWPPPKSASR